VVGVVRTYPQLMGAEELRHGEFVVEAKLPDGTITRALLAELGRTQEQGAEPEPDEIAFARRADTRSTTATGPGSSPLSISTAAPADSVVVSLCGHEGRYGGMRPETSDCCPDPAPCHQQRGPQTTDGLTAKPQRMEES
jgi:hypothetical protein